MRRKSSSRETVLPADTVTVDTPEQADRTCPLTRWTLIARVRTEDPRTREKALDELLSIYYPVLRKFLVAGIGIAPDAAGDLLHGFIADKVLTRNILAQARQEKGRFRSFLFQTIKNYTFSEFRKQQAQKRAPADAPEASLEALHSVPSADASQEELYNPKWARHTLAEARARMRRECEAKGRMDLWEIFDGRIVQPLLGAENALPYEILVARYGFQSPIQAANALITAKRMFKRVLEEVVRDTVETDAQVEEEIRELKRILSR